MKTDTRQRYTLRHRQTNDEWRFEETLGMRSSGALFGQRVMRFDTFARWGLSQERFSEKRPGRNLASSPDGQILEYDFHLDVLPAGKLSGNIYASELEDRIPRPFLPSLDRRRER